MQDFIIDVVIPWDIVNDKCDPRKTKDFLFLGEKIRCMNLQPVNHINILNDNPKETEDGVQIKVTANFNMDNPNITEKIVQNNIETIKRTIISFAESYRTIRLPRILFSKK